VCLAVLTLGSAWMMLLGPATESCTYVVLAPALGWWLVWAHAEGGVLARQALSQSAWLLGLCVLAGLSPNVTRFHGLGLHPLATLLFTAAAAAALLRGVARAPAHGVEDIPPICTQDRSRGRVLGGAA
jgi:hypothetical protein